MSDPKLISPLLDGFSLGNPLSSHDGVSCCPAIKENSEKKYIVKIITIPATQAQIDALLLAGAYRDPSGAMEYYSVIGEEVMKEAELLSTLSKLDGFLPYEGWQMEPITKRRLGYQVYLVGSYKRSLEKYVRRNPVTHLEAINLALDMCSALAVCRQAGSLYVDLKPSNIFMSEKKEYRIGDLGFISMDALSYTALPDKYRSSYTPPELYDPMATVNLTTDTYAVGMILYQLYNDGLLPFHGKAPEEALPSPMNADYELAEIILKAIDPDPSRRWDNPQEMGRALVEYMQRNAVNDVPITPHTPLYSGTQPPAYFSDTNQQSVLEQTEEPAQPTDEEPEQLSEQSEESTPIQDAAPAASEVQQLAISPFEDETLPGEEDANSLLPHEMSDELSRIIAKADDLLTHEIPEDMLIPETPVPSNPFDFVAVDPEDVDDSDVPLDPLMEEPAAEASEKKKKKTNRFASDEWKRKLKKFLSAALTLVLIIGAAAGGFWYYQNHYLQAIDSLIISGDRSELTVQVETAMDQSLLTVVCSDNTGASMTRELVNGTATFSSLRPNTTYKIQVEVKGIHGLTGETSNIFTTDATTNIIAFTAVTGPEDGSVVLSFTPDGEEPNMWTLIYSAEGEEPQRKNFDGHTVSLSGLPVGKLYTFTLEGEGNVPVSGKNSLTYMVSPLILAQNLTVDSATGTEITVRWDVPGDIVVDSWNVRCYSTSGYEKQVTVTETEAIFTEIDSKISYTVEVTADGMTQPARISITSAPIHINTIQIDDADPSSLKLTWEYTGDAPDFGWLVIYSVDGNTVSKNVVQCEEPVALIQPRIPDADYQFTIQADDSTTVFGGTYRYSTSDVPAFSANGLSAEQIDSYLVKTPAEEDWLFDNIGEEGFTSQFTLGEPISVVLHGKNKFYLPGSKMNVNYVIRDSQGNVISDLVSTSQEVWRDLWYPGDDQYAELDLPKVPQNPGNYSVTIYFDNAKVSTIQFTITP